MNAIDQTLPQLLTRISKQVDMRLGTGRPQSDRDARFPLSAHLQDRLRQHGAHLRGDDRRFLANRERHRYPTGGGGGGGGANGSTTTVRVTSDNKFWATLEKNVKDILQQTDKLLPAADPPAGTCSIAAGWTERRPLQRRPCPMSLFGGGIGHRQCRSEHRYRARNLAAA